MENKTTKTSELILTLDLGASYLKGIYTTCDSSDSTNNIISSIGMEPEIAKAPVALLKKTTDFDGKPENKAWFRKNYNDTHAIVTGALAKSFTAKEEQIANVKYEFAIDKCISSIGVIALTHGLTDTLIKISLNILIPSDEKESKDIIRDNLIKKLKKFYFRDERIRCKLTDFNCHIEGTGGILNRIERNQSNSKKIVAIMLGHRNCSCLVLDAGILKSSSIRLGFFDYIKDIRDNSIGQTIDNLEYIMPQVERRPEDKDILINSLIRGSNTSNQKSEKKKLLKAIQVSREIHWKKVSNWLETQIPAQLDEMVIMGGASEGFRHEILEYLSWVKVVDWCDETVKELKAFKKIDESLLLRYVDVFSLHKQYSTFNIEAVK